MNIPKKIISLLGTLGLAAAPAACIFPEVNMVGLSSLPDADKPQTGVRVHPQQAWAPALGLTETFAVFGGQAGISNAGIATLIVGDIGTTGASTTISGLHNMDCGYREMPTNFGSVSGSGYSDSPLAAGVDCLEGTEDSFAIANLVAEDALAIFVELGGRERGIDPGAGELGGLTLVPGVYTAGEGSFSITTGDLALDAQGDANAIWIFQMDGSLSVGDQLVARSVNLLRGAQAKNIYWRSVGPAVINPSGGGTMAGNLVAAAGVTISTSGNETVSNLNGKALGLFAAVKIANAVINSSYGPVLVPTAVEAPQLGTPPPGVEPEIEAKNAGFADSVKL